SIYVIRDGDTERLHLEVVDAGQFDDQSAQGERLISPMPGQVLSVAVKAGDEVTTDQVLLVIEAMKMEHAIKAPHAGSVSAVHFAVGDRVEEGVELVTLAETGS
ncbi:MAG: acetyl-CoA carboxylase biotin carboxyl carrier protein subunit, partial [Pseudomonadales bacterium]